MNIGEASKASGVTRKMIRYYESIGLVGNITRKVNGYRAYTESDIQMLAFIRRGRHLGFSIEQIQVLIALWRDKQRSSSEVKAIAERHLAELQVKLQELRSMQRTLEHLLSCCAGDDRPDCPIIDDLAASTAIPDQLKHVRRITDLYRR